MLRRVHVSPRADVLARLGVLLSASRRWKWRPRERLPHMAGTTTSSRHRIAQHSSSICESRPTPTLCSALLKAASFWRELKADRVLIFQSDALLLSPGLEAFIGTHRHGVLLSASPYALASS